MAKKRITFTLEESLIDDLKKHSKKTHIAQAKIVALALEEYIKRDKQDK